MSLRASPLVSTLLTIAVALPGHAAKGAAPEPGDGARCLALAIYWEAKHEGRRGMIAVGWVVKNRRAHADFPDTICAVVYQGGETPPCQFSWWCDGKSDRPREAGNWALAREVAAAMLGDYSPPDPTGGALFFHSADVDVPWARKRTPTRRVDNHLYYR